MRPAAALVLVLSSCGRPVFDEIETSLRDVSVTRRERVDPCAWDGGGLDRCFAVTASVFIGASCDSACARPGRAPGIFDPGQCARFCMPQPSCDWDGLGSRDAGVVTAWAFDGPRCVPLGDTAPGRAGVFATKAECETACPCDDTKLELSSFPSCQAEFVVAPHTVPPVPSWRTSDGRYQSTHAERRQTRASLAELCRATLASNVERVRCVGGE